jgi:hypothetical protein
MYSTTDTTSSDYGTATNHHDQTKYQHGGVNKPSDNNQ